MADEHIPHPDAQFDAWQHNFVTNVNSHPPDLPLTASDVAAPNNSPATWSTNHDIRTVREPLGHNKVRTTIMCTSLLNRGGKAVNSPQTACGEESDAYRA